MKEQKTVRKEENKKSRNILVKFCEMIKQINEMKYQRTISNSYTN